MYAVNINGGKHLSKLKTIFTDAFYIKKIKLNKNVLLPKVKKHILIKKIIPKVISKPLDILNIIKKDTKKKSLLKSKKYTNALKEFKNKNYSISYNLFDELFYTNLENININFYLGRSAFEVKNYEEALSAYERIIINRPQEIRIWLEIARTYYMQKDYQKSKQIFLDIKKQNPPTLVLTNINNYLSLIENKIKKHTFDGTLIMGIGYDSNIESKPDSFEYAGTLEDDYAFYHQEVLLLNHKYKYSDTLNIKNTFMVYNKGIKDYKSKNVKLVSYTPSIESIYKNYVFTYALNIDKLWYGPNPYLTTYSFIPKVSYKYSPKTTVESSFKYQSKSNLIKENENRDSTYIQADIAIKHILSKKILLKSLLLTSKERKDDGTTTNIDYTSYSLYAMLNYSYSPKIIISPKIKYTKKDYKDEKTSCIKNEFNQLICEEKKQKNDEYLYNITGTYLLSKKSIIQSIFNYKYNSSNTVDNKYEKYTLGVNFIKMF
ncbi:MAG TPA: tetratricopeptide repeat protein [Arcobacter sp.]|nr:tetratricopeptide repeat protein [Arcobacter sp.]